MPHPPPPPVLQNAHPAVDAVCESSVVVVVVVSKLEVALPDIDYIEIPAGWWDREADKSLLIGVHKHGNYGEFRHAVTVSVAV